MYKHFKKKLFSVRTMHKIQIVGDIIVRWSNSNGNEALDTINLNCIHMEDQVDSSILGKCYHFCFIFVIFIQIKKKIIY